MTFPTNVKEPLLTEDTFFALARRQARREHGIRGLCTIQLDTLYHYFNMYKHISRYLRKAIVQSLQLEHNSMVYVGKAENLSSSRQKTNQAVQTAVIRSIFNALLNVSTLLFCAESRDVKPTNLYSYNILRANQNSRTAPFVSVKTALMPQCIP